MSKISPNSYAALGLPLPPRKDELTAAVAVVKTSSLAANLTPDLGRLLRPQAAYRWLLPSLAAITPQYIEATLRGALAGNHVQAWELFDLMMDTWPELASCIQELTESVTRRKLVWTASADDDEQPTDEATQRLKVVQAALRRMRPQADCDENDLSGTVKDLMSAWFVGQAVLEVCWDKSYGNDELNIIPTTSLGDITAPRATFWVHPVCYAWSMEGRLGLRTELADNYRNSSATAKAQPIGSTTAPWNFITSQPRPSSIIEFPPEKFLVAIHKAKSGSALAGAMLRSLAWWWCAANFASDWLLNLSQLFGIPFRWVEYDPALPDPLKNELDAMLQNMGSSGWARFPAGTKMEFIDAGKSSDHSPQGELLDRCDRYARLLILGQTLSGGQSASKGGGKAFGAVEEGVKAKRVDAACDFVATIINTQLAPSILRVNYGDDDQCPVCSFLEEQEGTLEDSQRDTTLAQGGLKIGVNFLRKKYNIPTPDPDEETIGGQAEPMPGDEPKPGAGAGNAAGDAPIDDLEDRHALAAKASATPELDALAQTLHETLLPILKRLDAIAAVPDAAIQQHMIDKLLADFPAIASALAADDSLAKKLSPQLQSALIAGLQNPKP